MKSQLLRGDYIAGGLRAPPDHSEALTPTFADPPVVASARWVPYLVPSEMQRWNDCVINATTGWVECMFRYAQGPEAIPAGYQIDTKPLYVAARREFFPQETVESGGLYLHHGFLVAERLGVLPPGSKPASFKYSLGVASRLLKDQPLIQGTATHYGWSKPKTNGQIPIRGHIPNFQALHATLFDRVLEQSGEFYAGFQNSHGQHWGYEGVGLMRQDQWEQSLFGLCACILPDGWENWTGYKQFLVPHRVG